jgi:hypothetical protein
MESALSTELLLQLLTSNYLPGYDASVVWCKFTDLLEECTNQSPVGRNRANSQNLVHKR